MGRYDKIKINNGSTFVQPNRIRVYNNNNWRDLGTNDSDNQQSIYVYTNNTNKERVTLNKQINTVITEQYVESPNGFNLLPLNGFCYCPKFSNTTNATLIFNATIRKTSDTDKTVFYVANPSESCLFKIVWLANGKIQITAITAYYTGVDVTTTSNAVMANTWTNLNIRQEKESTTLTINFNGVTTTNYNATRTFNISNSTNIVGQAGVQFKDNLEVQGVSYPYNTNHVSLDMNSIDGNGGQYVNVTRVEVSTQEVTWV